MIETDLLEAWQTSSKFSNMDIAKICNYRVTVVCLMFLLPSFEELEHFPGVPFDVDY
jgi:hypothetical protein